MRRRFYFLLTALLMLNLHLHAEPIIVTPPAYNEGDDYYEISTWEELLYVSQNADMWNENFVQLNDIAFPLDGENDIRNWNQGEGWSPIGMWGSGEHYPPFTGTYNGQDYVIENLFANRGEDRNQESFVGLFGHTRNAELTHINLKNTSIRGYEGVGGIAGAAEYTRIMHCSVSGSIQGVFAVGGIAGYVVMGMISESYNQATVQSVSVDGTAGGVVGWLYEGALNSSYNLGEISGYNFVGGLVGYGGIDDIRISAVILRNSFSAGTIEILTLRNATDNAVQKPAPSGNLLISPERFSEKRDLVYSPGGVIGGLRGDIEILNCLFDKEMAESKGTAIEADNFGAIGKPTSEMQDIATYDDWGISERPDIPAGGYPMLAWELDESGGRNAAWVIGTGGNDPVPVPLSNMAIYLGAVLMVGLLVIRIRRGL